MENIKKESRDYLKLLQQRAKESRIYKPCQSTGLAIMDLLMDLEHKSLYMRLAKQYDNGELLQLAKDVSERKDVKSKGAYFMGALRKGNISKIKEV
ncbi:MAG: hypothetical protein AAB674_02270 [Patescibacteria group bacterium]